MTKTGLIPRDNPAFFEKVSESKQESKQRGDAMNGIDQRKHRTVTQELARSLAVVAEELESLRAAISKECTARLKLAERTARLCRCA